MNIIFAPRLSHEMIDRLQVLIEQHHSLFQSAFKHHLTPKLHFMTRYPSVIRRMVSLINLWCMRYEGKHAVSKMLVMKCRNFKNLAKTLAHKI